MKYGELNLGQIEALVNNLGGMDAVRKILSGTVVVALAAREFLTLVKTVALRAAGGKKTSDCFRGQRYGYRDSDLDRWLPKKQPAADPCRVTSRELDEPMTFKEMAEAILGETGDITTLARLLKERGHTVTLEQIESLIELQENGEDVGLQVSGYANFFFVEDDDGSVSVVYARRRGGRWGVGVGRLGSGDRWRTESRVFARN